MLQIDRILLIAAKMLRGVDKRGLASSAAPIVGAVNGVEGLSCERAADRTVQLLLRCRKLVYAIRRGLRHSAFSGAGDTGFFPR